MTSRAYPLEHPDVGVELVREWAPSANAKAIVIIVHGIAEHSGRYERTGSLLAEAGYRVRSYDLIGAGGSGGPRWDITDWNKYHDQVTPHIEWARHQKVPVVLLGHSMGANISLGYALSSRPQPDYLVLSAPALAGGAGWQRALAPLAAKLAPRMTMSNSVKGEQLSRDPEVGEKYFGDPLVIPRSTTRLGAQLFAEMDLLSETYQQLELPTLVLHGGDDVLVPTDCSEVLGELDNVERLVYDGLRHEILNEPEGPQVVADIVKWLDDQISAS